MPARVSRFLRPIAGVIVFVFLGVSVPTDAKTINVSLVTLVQWCAPGVSPRTALAVMQVESGGYPWIIDDDTAGKSTTFTSREEAVYRAADLLLAGHNVDVGLAQVNSSNFRAYARYGLAARDGSRSAMEQALWRAFDPCINVLVGMDILMNAYFGREYMISSSAARRASGACRMTLRRDRDGQWYCRSGGTVDRYGPGQLALFHAFEVYNSNHDNGAPRYAKAVWEAGWSLR